MGASEKVNYSEIRTSEVRKPTNHMGVFKSVDLKKRKGGKQTQTLIPDGAVPTTGPRSLFRGNCEHWGGIWEFQKEEVYTLVLQVAKHC